MKRGELKRLCLSFLYHHRDSGNYGGTIRNAVEWVAERSGSRLILRASVLRAFRSLCEKGFVSGGQTLLGMRPTNHYTITPAGVEVFLRLSESERQEIDASPEVLLQAIVEPVDLTAEGQLIRAVGFPWLAISREVERNPEFLNEFVRYPRKFEEFIAATYDQAGFDEVTLTPQRGDGGIDVIAVKHGFGSVRFLDQVKAYSPGHLVTHDDVRATVGVLTLNPNASKGLVTTTSDFAPGVYAAFRPLVPDRLELRNGHKLLEWIQTLT